MLKADTIRAGRGARGVRSKAPAVLTHFSLSKLVGILCSLVLTAIAMVLAYQVRPQYDIRLGTTTDAALLQGFDGAEGDGASSGGTYRWSSGDASITLGDVGRQDFDVTMQFNGWRPPGQPRPILAISVGSQVLLQASPPPQIIEYSFRVPKELVLNGTLALHLTVNPFSIPNDPRELGIWTMRVRVSPAQNGASFIGPPAGTFIGVLGAAALLAVGLVLLGWGAGMVVVGTALVGLFAIWLLAADRLWFTTGQWYLVWPQVIFAGLVFTLLAGWLGGLVLRVAGAHWSVIQRRVLLTVMLAAFVVRLGGQLHPQIHVVDLGYHVHRLEAVESGQLLFTSFAVQSGSRYSFYLPTAYVFMLPMKWVLGDEYLTVMLFTVGISTLGALPLFYMAKRLLGDGRAGVLASALYLVMPMSVIPFSWGITADLFAEFFALLVLALLVGAYGSFRPTRPVFWLFAAVLFVALLGHSAVVQLVAVAFLVTLALWWVSKRLKQGRRQVAWALGAFALASLTAFVVYYRNWIGDILSMINDMRLHNAAQTTSTGLHVKVSGAVDDRTLGLVPTYATTRIQWILGGLKGFWQEAQAYYRVWPIAGATFGWLLIWPSRLGGAVGNSRVRLALAVLGWTLSVAFFALIGLLLNLYVRYMLFALPVVALCGGLLLSATWRRGRAGMMLSLLIVAFFTIEALVLWQYRINYLYK